VVILLLLVGLNVTANQLPHTHCLVPLLVPLSLTFVVSSSEVGIMVEVLMLVALFVRSKGMN
jgi:uncharacterized membrane protein